MPPPLPGVRAQDAIRQEWLKARLERVLPGLMRRHGVAMWIVVCREYNEDPVFFSLVSPSVMAARRRTMLVFNDLGPEKGVERLALGGGSNGGLYRVYRDPDSDGRELWGQGQWTLLRRLVDERRPATIAVNVSQTHAFSDGLTVGEWEQLGAALGPWTAHIVRAEELPLEYVEARLPEMLPTYRHMMRIVHALLARAFSGEVVTPGRTGNEVLADALAAMKAAGVEGSIYTHPIGDHGHGAGPLIGLWDRQDGVPGRGDVRLWPSTWFSIELQATTAVPEWAGQPLRSAQEEDAVLGEDGRMAWVLERQTRYHLVR